MHEKLSLRGIQNGFINRTPRPRDLPAIVSSVEQDSFPAPNLPHIRCDGNALGDLPIDLDKFVSSKVGLN